MRFKIILAENKFLIMLDIGENINRFCYHGEVLLSTGGFDIKGRF